MEQGEDETDLGALWEEAVMKYQRDTPRSLLRFLPSQWNAEAILAEQEQELRRFTKWRHDEGLLDTLRSKVARNSKIIQAFAKTVSDAAAVPFPPSATIMTAFTLVMKASDNVTKDYDLVVSFFDLMQSFLERVSLLENRIPAEKRFKTILTRVFASLLVLCGIAAQKITDKRMWAFFNAIIKGSDEVLRSSFNAVETSIQRLESATLFATLGTAIDTKTLAGDIFTLQKQQGVVLVENLNVAYDIKDDTKHIMQLLTGLQSKNRDDAKSGPDSGKLIDSGAKRPQALKQIRDCFQTGAKPLGQFTEIGSLYVKDTFNWLTGEKEYQSFKEGKTPLLFVYGQNGMGKSFIAYWLIKQLEALALSRTDRQTTVAYFFFQEEHEEHRSIKLALDSMIVQMAEANPAYCKAAAAEVHRLDDPFDEDDVKKLWARYFASQYPKDGPARLFLVLDGFDEADEEDQAQLVDLLGPISKDELNIQVVLTGRPHIAPIVEPLAPVPFEITKTKIARRSGDLWKIVLARCKKLHKLKRLRPQFWKTIAVELKNKADSILYVEHMLQRLNKIGREFLISKELKNLPDNLKQLYRQLLSEFQAQRTDEEIAAFKKLFAWLAYSKRPLNLGEASSLVTFVCEDKLLVLEQEIEDRASRILRITTNSADDGDDDGDPNSETELPGEDGSGLSQDDYIDASRDVPLQFQERSLRQYFREMDVDKVGLRHHPQEAHLTIFVMSVQILVSAENDFPNEDEKAWFEGLRCSYATDYWVQHFLEIEVKEVSDVDAGRVIQSLHTIFRPHSEVLKLMALTTVDDTFGDKTDHVFQAIASWSRRACDLATGLLSDDVRKFMSDLTISNETFLLHLAKCHVLNWLSATDSYEVVKAYYDHAVATFDLMDREFEQPKDIPKVFPDIEMTANAYRTIGMVTYKDGDDLNTLRTALVQLLRSRDTASSDLDRFRTLFAFCETKFRYFQSVEKDDPKIVHQAYIYIKECLELVPSLSAQSGLKNDKDFMDQVAVAMEMKAECEVRFGCIDDAFRSAEKAKAYNPKARPYTKLLCSLSQTLGATKAYGDLMQLAEKMPSEDVIDVLGWPAGTAMAFAHAAKETGKQDFMLQAFYKAIATPHEQSKWLRAIWQLHLASIQRRVMCRTDEAMKLLKEIVDGTKSGYYSPILQARHEIVEILMDKFRTTGDAQAKADIYKEIQQLVLEDVVAQSDNFNPYESQTALPLYLMAKKLDTPQKAESILQRIFKAHITALKDNDGLNDSRAFRLLAKTLACVEGFELEAQISISLQYSVVDQNIYDATLRGLPRGDSSDEDEGSDGDGGNNGDEDTNGEKGNSKHDGLDEDENVRWNLGCNGCRKNFPNWKAGHLYYCLICMDTDLCEADYQKRQAMNRSESRGETYDSSVWQTFCGSNHRYIRGPIEGWKGVKDGVIRYGEASVPFKTWLADVEKKWDEKWKEFWKGDEGLRDVF